MSFLPEEKQLTVAIAVNRPFGVPLTYRVPDALKDDLPVGSLVEVPLQRGKEFGCVVEHNPPLDPKVRLRDVIRRVSPQYEISEELIKLGQWMAGYYFCGIGEALATISMIGLAHLELKSKSYFRLSPHWVQCDLTKRQREAAKVLANKPDLLPMVASDLAREAECSTPIINKMFKVGALVEEVDILHCSTEIPSADIPPELLPEQQDAYNVVAEYLDGKKFGVVLLHGVTGSGKTEVYLRLIQRVLDEGKTALCLVPEISLTPQTVDRFAQRFQEEIGVFHSQMTKREKFLLYEKIRRGVVRLVIGARSASFAPFQNLGIIIIDEEHENSYKQSDSPRYQARDTAIVRARGLGIPVLLGSATPSLESYENACRGKYKLAQLKKRPSGAPMPEVRIISMGKVAVESAEENGGVTLLSGELREAIQQRLDRGEQTLLFLNRRGFSNFLMCPSCKWVARCEDDDIVKTIHRLGGRTRRQEPEGEELELELFPRPLKAQEAYIKCHFCGRKSEYPTECPECGEKELMAMGSGTQRMEECLARVFPDVNILRLDHDSVGGRQKFLKAWQEMVYGDAQIILGTQMIAKGLHLERVTLVGVLLAEIGLFLPDFRAEERTFSLLTQVAGRSGRSNMGEVIFQTYMPHHAAVQLAARHDFEGFFEVEMKRREKMRFPPVQRLIALTLSDTDFGRCVAVARLFGAVLRRYGNQGAFRHVAVLGPQSAPVERLAGRFRQRILLRGGNQHQNAALLRSVLMDREWKPPSSVKLSIDVDPQDLL